MSGTPTMLSWTSFAPSELTSASPAIAPTNSPMDPESPGSSSAQAASPSTAASYSSSGAIHEVCRFASRTALVR